VSTAGSRRSSAQADPATAELPLSSLPPLQPTSPLPLYAQLAERLAGAIRPRRAALAGHMLPGELHLMQHFGVSRPTVRQAMAQLVLGGLVTRGRGRGTFIAPERLNHDVSLAFEDEMRAARKTVRFAVLSRETLAPGAAAQAALDIGPLDAIERIERLRFLDDEPFAHEQRSLPAALAGSITQSMLENLAIISLLTEAAERPARITNTVRCMAGDARITGLLGLRPRTPLLQTEHVYYAASGAPMLHGVVRFRWDRVQFTMASGIESAP
jgi:GntR family transcriptional regulator